MIKIYGPNYSKFPIDLAVVTKVLAMYRRISKRSFDHGFDFQEPQLWIKYGYLKFENHGYKF